MADDLNIKKISLLSNAATLTGSELIPCVQNGVTYKTTVTKIKGTTKHSDLTEVKEAADGESEGHVNSDLYNEIKSSSNIIANLGVGLDASKPVTGLTIGYIYVSTDTFLAYTATSTTELDSGVDLLAKQYITDSLDNNKLYQYNGSNVLTILYNSIPSITTIASSATPTPTGDSRENELYITALAVDATFTNPSGTYTKGNNLIIKISPTTTVYTLDFGTEYTAFAEDLPTTTITGKGMILGFIYDGSFQLMSLTNQI